MPLTPQTVDIPLVGGLETETNRRLVPGNKLLKLENLCFRGGTLERRPGTAALEESHPDGAVALATRDSEVVAWPATDADGGRVLSRYDGEWVSVGRDGDGFPLEVEVRQAVRRPLSQEGLVSASLSGYIAYAWVECERFGAPKVRLSVVEEATGRVYQDATLLHTGPSGTLDFDAFRPRVRIVALSSSFIVVYSHGAASRSSLSGNIYARAVRVSAPEAVGPQATLAADLDVRNDLANHQPLDVASLSASVALLAYTSVAGATPLIRLLKLSEGSAPSYISTGSPGTTTLGVSFVSGLAIGVLAEGGAFCLLYIDSAYNVLAAWLTDSIYDPINDFTAATLSGLNTPRRIGVAQTGTGTLLVVVDADRMLVRCKVDEAGVSEAASNWAPHVRLLAHPFVRAERVFAAVVYSDQRDFDEATQPTVFFLDATDAGAYPVLARLLDSSSGPLHVEVQGFGRAVSVGGEMAVPVPVRGRLTFSGVSAYGNADDATPLGAALAVTRDASPADSVRLESNGCLHVSGSVPMHYDGVSFVEDGFHLYPEVLLVNALSNAASGITGDLDVMAPYAYVAVYEWTDAEGRLHRSAPSIPTANDPPVSGTDMVANYVVVTACDFSRRNGVRIALYRTTTNGTVFYRVPVLLDAPSFVLTDYASPVVAFMDNTTDENLVANEVLYTTGGILDYMPPPAGSILHRHLDYLFSNRSEDPHGFAYTLPLVQGEAPAWSEKLRGRVPSETGAITAFATLDSNLVILTERAGYVVTGRGPTATGGDNQFSDPQRIAGCTGCEDWRHVANIPSGLLYRSPEGFRLLTRSLEVDDAIGGGVAQWAGLTVKRALDVPSFQEVRFFTQEGRTLVYNYRWGQWATFTEQPAVDAVLVGGVVHYATGAEIRAEEEGLYTEAGQAVPYTVGSAWFRFGSLQGYQRIWRVVLLGDAESNFTTSAGVTITTSAYYDFNEETATTTAAHPLATAGKAWQVRHGPQRQTCQAARFEWTLNVPAEDSLSFAIGFTAVSLEMGMGPLAAKLSRSQSK